MIIDRRDIKARLAINEEGPRVAELAAQAGFVFSDWEIDWSDIHPHWLVADHRGELLGCMQLCYGRPVGRLEILSVDTSLEKPVRAYVVNLIGRTAMKIMKDYGAQAVSAMIPFEMKGWKRWLKLRGGVTLVSGNLLLYRME
jgi:hypothetical protein